MNPNPQPLSREEREVGEKLLSNLYEGFWEDERAFRLWAHSNAQGLLATCVVLEHERDRLRECLEPGTSSAIVNGMFNQAERLGIYRPTAKHALTQFVEEIERLRATLAQHKADLRAAQQEAVRLHEKLLERVDFRTKGHPEADGRQPVAGDHAYTFTFPLENGGELRVHGGHEDLERFSDMIGRMMIDDDADSPPV